MNATYAAMTMNAAVGAREGAFGPWFIIPTEDPMGVAIAIALASSEPEAEAPSPDERSDGSYL